jgi:hypothetical protein
MNIRIYKRGEDVQLSHSFHLREFECKCGRCPDTKVDLDHVVRLQQLRDDLGLPITVNSAYRCLVHNTAIGGEKDSRHMKGEATDIQVRGMSPDKVADTCENRFDGIGRYNSFTHTDSRGSRARWDYRTATPTSGSKLPDGPSDSDINVSLKEIEDDIL